MEQIQWWRNYFKNAPSEPTKATRRPSGAQAGPDGPAEARRVVSRRACPLVASTTSSAPSLGFTQSSRRPSGDHCGSVPPSRVSPAGARQAMLRERLASNRCVRSAQWTIFQRAVTKSALTFLYWS